MLMASLSSEQLDDLQGFLKDWLRHKGRTQADLRRALRASSIRMPVLLDVLQATYAGEGLPGIAHQLCAIEDSWHGEESDGTGDGVAQDVPAEHSLGQLDLLLQQIRGDLQA